MVYVAELADRAVLRVTGADRVGFLNGLVSNDVALAGPARAVWAALLTPQGKWLADFFVTAAAAALLLDVEAGQADFIRARLLRYRLRADVQIERAPLTVYTAWGEGAVGVADPRLPEAGVRFLRADRVETNADFADWDRHRLGLGLPDGSRDLETDKTVLLEAGFDELGGVSWSKGCYMGQELTARTKYRGLVKRRLLKLVGDGVLPPAGTPILAGEREVGQVRSSHGAVGLGLVRLEALGATALSANGLNVRVEIPAWVKLPVGA